MTKIYARPGTEGFFRTFEWFPVCDEWKQELYNYFIEGFEPGSFHRACFENDLLNATFRSHPSNQWRQIQEFMKWLANCAPMDSFGNRENVKEWLELDTEKRYEICYKKGWVLTDEEITWEKISGKILVKNPLTGEPV